MKTLFKKYTGLSIAIIGITISAFFFASEKEHVKESILDRAVEKYLTKEFNPIKTRYYNSSGEIMKPSKVWEGIVVPTGSTQTIDISSAGFNTIRKINITGGNNTSTLTSMPFAVIKSYSTTQIQVTVLASNNQIINLFGTAVNGLVLATGLTGMELHVEVNGD